MHKKLKLQKLMIAILSVVIAIVAVTALLGRNSTKEILVVSKKIDLSKSLGEQKQAFKKVKVSKRDYTEIGGDLLVADWKELENKYLLYKLEKGTPVPKALLEDRLVSGEFAKSLEENYTIFKISQGASKLPAGVVAGDKINVGLTAMVIESEGEKEKQILTSGILLRDVLVYNVDETDVQIKVTESEYLMLVNAAELGQFILQLPGKKPTPTCYEVEQEVIEYIKKQKEKNKKKEFDQEKMIKERQEETSCKKEEQKATKVTQEEILQKLKNSSIDGEWTSGSSLEEEDELDFEDEEVELEDDTFERNDEFGFETEEKTNNDLIINP